MAVLFAMLAERGDTPARRKYKLEMGDYLLMAARQGDKCAICAAETRLVIDHDHDTGAVRGLLCSHCNSGLGFFKDDPGRLIAGARYLRQGGFVWGVQGPEEGKLRRYRRRPKRRPLGRTPVGLTGDA